MRNPITDHAALIVVDIQPDFMSGGPLACHHADELLRPLQRVLTERRFKHVVATQDWHPPQHASFASQHPGQPVFAQVQRYGELQTLWPDHCIEGSPGAALDPRLDWSAVDLILRKGRDSAVDSYSAFRENIDAAGLRRSTGLSGWLQARGVTDVWVCGLARNVCVLWTALDAQALGFRTYLSWPLSRPVSPDSDPATRACCQQHGIIIIETDA